MKNIINNSINIDTLHYDNFVNVKLTYDGYRYSYDFDYTSLHDIDTSSTQKEVLKFLSLVIDRSTRGLLLYKMKEELCDSIVDKIYTSIYR